ncbi:hypothetical protein PROFUN_09162 [Planoprotostelium fungivorum]|uniref:Uncharacterized protein n=1 Tax=Planoprotostelium fungivorum TaxID=1890364 RepID=A0A2P6MVJ4_9EUKA|nr:hypothetical protein PROFUN_09162 [Planoprotostelium fungivorum]
MAKVYPFCNVELGTKLHCNHQFRQCSTSDTGCAPSFSVLKIIRSVLFAGSNEKLSADGSLLHKRASSADIWMKQVSVAFGAEEAGGLILKTRANTRTSTYVQALCPSTVIANWLL